GSVVGAAARAGGARVLWVSGGRSGATRSRAKAAGLEDVRALSELVSQSETILSICPPANALGIAREVALLGFGGTYVDGNAVSPATTRVIGDVVADGGARYVDGGIIGPPPRKSGTTRLYLSGQGAREVAALFRGSNLEAIPLDGPIGAASAMKVAYA